ncbi:hypothetical protein HPB50_011270 [Hyalomma asiaticum]|uniref:Uncharacterized protein n=1 Tax=Hyalomma asiaticum TaxID=266040 RepID=A0ACB7T7N5_HYAAI|nr:hypothetical protein HPB50_011270 [Hyalomma asiaticum]
MAVTGQKRNALRSAAPQDAHRGSAYIAMLPPRERRQQLSAESDHVTHAAKLASMETAQRRAKRCVVLSMYRPAPQKRDDAANVLRLSSRVPIGWTRSSKRRTYRAGQSRPRAFVLQNANIKTPRLFERRKRNV